MSATAATQTIISQRDEQDALRLVQAAVATAAMPGFMSGAARDLAMTRLRELAAGHPRSADVFAAVVQHLESY